MGHPVIIRLWALALLSAYGAVAFDTDWTRLWSTVHDGDDPIERELLGRLANAKEEHLDSESTFCSARYYKPLVHKSGYGNQVLSLGPHLIAAKLMRRIFLLEPFHTLHASTRGEEIAYGKMLDPEGAAKFVGTAVAADEFGRCAGGGVPVAPRKAGGGGMVAKAAPKADLLFKYGTIPACSAVDGAFAQVWDRDEFLRQCSAVPHGVSANTWARAMWLISNGEATEPTAMAAFSLCGAVRSKEVVSYCPRAAVPMLDLPLAPRGIFQSIGAAGDLSGLGRNPEAGLLRKKFSNHSTPCLRHFVDPSEDDDNGGDKSARKRRNAPHAPAECSGTSTSACAVGTYCRMLRQAAHGLGANMWTQRLGRWLVGELKNMAAHAAAQSATWHRERKAELAREEEEDRNAARSVEDERSARQEMAARQASIAAEAAGITGVEHGRGHLSGGGGGHRGGGGGKFGGGGGGGFGGGLGGGGEMQSDPYGRQRLLAARGSPSQPSAQPPRRSLLGKASEPHLPPAIAGPPPGRGYVLALHLRMADCFTSADPQAKQRPCANTKGFTPEQVPLVVRAVTRLISDRKVPHPAALFIASNWAGLFKVFPRELWHAHGVTRVFGWVDLQGRVGGEFRDFNVVTLEQEVLRLSDGGLVAGLHSTLGLWTAQRRWVGFGDELTVHGDNKVAPHRPTRAVFALEELHAQEDEVGRTSMALTGSPLDAFNDTVTNAACSAGHGYPPNACPCVALRQEYMVKSGAGFGALPKNLYKAWGALRCDAILCEPLRPRDAAAAKAGERFPCRRRFWDDVMKFAPKAVPSDKKKKKKKRVQIK